MLSMEQIETRLREIAALVNSKSADIESLKTEHSMLVGYKQALTDANLNSEETKPTGVLLNE